ncbi:opioid growth factor receptor-like [Dendropsophus ebraccatus]|uniref:opioid growth factor receptor-like n=1 Tax=Dendropsophus ebraccatus TaxID=150705 RepID=UPI0038311429
MSRDGGEDGWTSEYDSTWEDEEEDGRKEERARERRTQRRSTYPRRWRNRAARDLQCYRHGYREEHANDQSCTGETSKAMPNLEFYQNKKCFEPNGVLIEELLKEWEKDYPTLERNHSYIQWLFPLREYGMNSYAKPLTLNEIEMMMKDKVVMDRFLRAYKLMLQFYGIELISDETGAVQRAEKWEERFKNLNYHSHNNLRITRILKCLGEMGYIHFQAPLVKFFLEETLIRDKLPNVKRSVLDYFMFAVKDKHERRKLVHYAWKNYKPNNHQDRFIWGPVEKIKQFQHWENDVNVGSEEPQCDIKKNRESKVYKNDNKGQPILSIHGGRARDDTVTVNHHGPKVEKAISRVLIPMEERGGLSENSPDQNLEVKNDRSTPLFTDANSSNAKKEKFDGEDAKEDSSKEEVIKKSEFDQESEVNGLPSQNAEKKQIQGDHRKRKMPDSSSISSAADGCTAGDATGSCHSASLRQEEGGQVDGVEDKVKKLKLGEKQNPYHSNGLEEDNPPDDTTPKEMDENPASPNLECNSTEHSQDLHTDE